MLKVAFVALCAVTSPLYGLASNTQIENRDPFFKAISNASAYVRMMDADPFERTESKDGPTVLREKEFKQEGCSAVYIRKPATFLTSATCFAGADGKLDRFRRFAVLFAHGQRYNIDAASIVIHEQFNANPSTNDVAVFHLEAESAALYQKTHAPIAVIPVDMYVVEGQRVTALGFGATSEKGGDFGFARAKEFIQVYPDPENIQQANGALNLSPEEGLLTYIARTAGVNCKGDSGGGVFVQADRYGAALETFLQSLMVGKVGPQGDVNAPCESISRYMVGIDLRRYHQWIAEAVDRAESQSKAARERLALFETVQTEVFGKVHTSKGIYLLPDEFEKIAEPYAALTAAARAQALVHHLRVHAALSTLRVRLVGTSAEKATLGTVAMTIPRDAIPKPALVTLTGPIQPALMVSPEEKAFQQIGLSFQPIVQQLDREVDAFKVRFESGRIGKAEANQAIANYQQRANDLRSQLAAAIDAHNRRWKTNRQMPNPKK